MPNTEQAKINAMLSQFNISQNSVLLIHSSMKKLHAQGVRAESIIETMLNFFDTGTILMPSMSWRSVNPSNPIFFEASTPSNTGILSEIFRLRYATHRSLHPTHSVVGSGKLASTLLATHHIGNTPVPLSSPYGLMQAHSSYILLLGVGIETCTAIHLPEELLAPEIYLVPEEEAEPYTLIDKNGKQYAYKLRRHVKAARNTSFFYKIEPLLRPKLTSGRIGDVNWQLIPLDYLMRVSIKELKHNKNFLIQD